MATSLVTGGAGFIGSHLCGKLIELGHDVVCFDNFITGSKKNIKNFLHNPKFRLVESDISGNVSSVGITYDYIFHLASPASPKGYQENPEETLLANSQGTLNVLNLAKEGRAKVLIASTSEVYGDPKVSPQTENYWGNVNSFGPRACYDESKRFAEAAAYVFLKKYGIDARIIRIFNTYGPNMQKDDGRVVSNFINQCLSGEPITIYGDGSQTRSFCYVDDMVEGIWKAMDSDNTKGEVFNLGNPEEYTMSDLAQKIKSATGSGSEVVNKDLPEDDPKQRKPDITKAKNILGWEPSTSLDTGLSYTIKYYKGE